MGNRMLAGFGFVFVLVACLVKPSVSVECNFIYRENWAIGGDLTISIPGVTTLIACQTFLKDRADRFLAVTYNEISRECCGILIGTSLILTIEINSTTIIAKPTDEKSTTSSGQIMWSTSTNNGNNDWHGDTTTNRYPYPTSNNNDWHGDTTTNRYPYPTSNNNDWHGDTTTKHYQYPTSGDYDWQVESTTERSTDASHTASSNSDELIGRTTTGNAHTWRTTDNSNNWLTDSATTDGDIQSTERTTVNADFTTTKQQLPATTAKPPYAPSVTGHYLVSAKNVNGVTIAYYRSDWYGCYAWDKAVSLCQGVGWYLAQLPSDSLMNLAISMDIQFAWIGAYQGTWTKSQLKVADNYLVSPVDWNSKPCGALTGKISGHQATYPMCALVCTSS